MNLERVVSEEIVTIVVDLVIELPSVPTRVVVKVRERSRKARARECVGSAEIHSIARGIARRVRALARRENDSSNPISRALLGGDRRG